MKRGFRVSANVSCSSFMVGRRVISVSGHTVLSLFPFLFVPVSHSGNRVSSPGHKDRDQVEWSQLSHSKVVVSSSLLLSCETFKLYFSVASHSSAGISKGIVWWWRARARDETDSSKPFESSELAVPMGLPWHKVSTMLTHARGSWLAASVLHGMTAKVTLWSLLFHLSC